MTEKLQAKLAELKKAEMRQKMTVLQIRHYKIDGTNYLGYDITIGFRAAYGDMGYIVEKDGEVIDVWGWRHESLWYVRSIAMQAVQQIYKESKR